MGSRFRPWCILDGAALGVAALLAATASSFSLRADSVPEGCAPILATQIIVLVIYKFLLRGLALRGRPSFVVPALAGIWVITDSAEEASSLFRSFRASESSSCVPGAALRPAYQRTSLSPGWFIVALRAGNQTAVPEHPR